MSRRALQCPSVPTVWRVSPGFLAMAGLPLYAAADKCSIAMQMYLYVGNWKFKVMERKEVERQAVALRMTALDGHGKQHANSPQNGDSRHDMNTVHDLENGASLSHLLCSCLSVRCSCCSPFQNRPPYRWC